MSNIQSLSARAGAIQVSESDFMNQVTRALLALAAGLVFACGNAGDPSVEELTGQDGYVNGDGDWRPCDPITEGEQKYVNGPGWTMACAGWQRMANVKVGWEEGSSQGEDREHAPPPSAWPQEEAPPVAPEGDYGSAKEAITFGAGAGHSVSIVNNKIQAFNGRCNPVAGSGSIVDTCILPEKVNMMWAMCPSTICGQMTSSDVSYFRDRFRAGWDTWRWNTSCGGSSTTPAIPDDIDTHAGFDAAAYNSANIPVWYATGATSADRYIGSTYFFNGGLATNSQVVNRVKYWTYRYAGIEIDYEALETLKTSLCQISGSSLGATNYGNAIKRAYERIFAHELGHVWGVVHQTSGIMRRGPDQTCAEIFDLNPLPHSDADSQASLARVQEEVASEVTRYAIGTLRNSSGFNPVAVPSCTGPALTNDTSDRFASD